MSVSPDRGAIATAEAEATVAACVTRARTGDRAAFAQLVRLHQSRVRLQLRRLVGGDAALADDLAQETFVQAWRHLATFRGEARFSTWLHRIALTRFLQHRRRPALPVDWTRDVDAGDAAPATGDDPRDVDDLRLDVEQALARLTEIQRLAVVHCFHLDLTHAEAAQVLGLPLGTLKSHLERAKTRLRPLLGAWQPESAT